MSNPYTRLIAPGPVECRDLHNIRTGDGTPIVPLDHWGVGCPFEEEGGAACGKPA